MIYQEPMASLNPAMKIGAQLTEVPMIHEGMAKAEAWDAAPARSWPTCACPTPTASCNAYPHQLSGGQQQRIVIAMALMSKPALLILDEPTTALDVTVEAGIVDLVKDLGHKYGTSMLFISHNLGLVLDVCDRHLRDVFRRGGGDRHDRRGLRPDAPPLYPGAVPLDPAAGRRQERAAADRDSRQLPPAPRTPAGLQLRPALRLFRRPAAAMPPMCRCPVSPAATATTRRCLRCGRDRLGRAARSRARSAKPPPVGEVVLKMDDLKKYYEVVERRSSAAAPRRWSRPTRPSASRRARARRWPSSANRAAASPPSPRC